jgi:hypothetical protein
MVVGISRFWKNCARNPTWESGNASVAQTTGSAAILGIIRPMTDHSGKVTWPDGGHAHSQSDSSQAAEPSRSQPSSWDGSLSCWPRRRGRRVAGSMARQVAHVHPEFLELAHREDILLAVAPAFFHVLERDVGGHAGGQRRGRRRRPCRGPRDRRAVRLKAASRGRCRSSRCCCCSR